MTKNKNKAKKPKKNKAASPLSHYIAGGAVILILALGYLNQKANIIESATKVKNYKILNESTSPSPSATPAVKGVVTKPTTVNTDPVVNCDFTYLPDQKMKSGECSKFFECQIGSQWLIYTSREKCSQDQNASQPTQHPSNDINVNVPSYAYPTYTPTTYYNCTLYYPYSKKYITYDHLYKTKAECDTQQVKLDQSVVSPTPILTPQAPQITKSQCTSAVNDKWRSLMIVQYGCSYPCPDTGDCGHTSVCEVLWHQVQQDMAICEQYP